jgi:hypothetical protein
LALSLHNRREIANVEPIANVFVLRHPKLARQRGRREYTCPLLLPLAKRENETLHLGGEDGEARGYPKGHTVGIQS